jgi:pyrimidine deaminase RibD-like protein
MSSLSAEMVFLLHVHMMKGAEGKDAAVMASWNKSIISGSDAYNISYARPDLLITGHPVVNLILGGELTSGRYSKRATWDTHKEPETTDHKTNGLTFVATTSSPDAACAGLLRKLVGRQGKNGSEVYCAYYDIQHGISTLQYEQTTFAHAVGRLLLNKRAEKDKNDATGIELLEKLVRSDYSPNAMKDVSDWLSYISSEEKVVKRGYRPYWALKWGLRITKDYPEFLDRKPKGEKASSYDYVPGVSDSTKTMLTDAGIIMARLRKAHLVDRSPYLKFVKETFLPPQNRRFTSVKKLTEVERHTFFVSLTQAMVGVTDRSGESRDLCRSGLNVGSLLVSPDGEVLAWAVNTNANHMFLHGEVNLIHAFELNNETQSRIPPNCTIYTSLEPCEMCSGMIFEAAKADHSVKVVEAMYDTQLASKTHLTETPPNHTTKPTLIGPEIKKVDGRRKDWRTKRAQYAINIPIQPLFDSTLGNKGLTSQMGLQENVDKMKQQEKVAGKILKAAQYPEISDGETRQRIKEDELKKMWRQRGIEEYATERQKLLVFPNHEDTPRGGEVTSVDANPLLLGLYGTDPETVKSLSRNVGDIFLGSKIEKAIRTNMYTAGKSYAGKYLGGEKVRQFDQGKGGTSDWLNSVLEKREAAYEKSEKKYKEEIERDKVEVAEFLDHVSDCLYNSY